MIFLGKDGDIVYRNIKKKPGTLNQEHRKIDEKWGTWKRTATSNLIPIFSMLWFFYVPVFDVPVFDVTGSFHIFLQKLTELWQLSYKKKCFPFVSFPDV
jgi:hypothetical protein